MMDVSQLQCPHNDFEMTSSFVNRSMGVASSTFPGGSCNLAGAVQKVERMTKQHFIKNSQIPYWMAPTGQHLPDTASGRGLDLALDL